MLPARAAAGVESLSAAHLPARWRGRSVALADGGESSIANKGEAQAPFPPPVARRGLKRNIGPKRKAGTRDGETQEDR